jgi:hypothetical protein
MDSSQDDATDSDQRHPNKTKITQKAGDGAIQIGQARDVNINTGPTYPIGVALGAIVLVAIVVVILVVLWLRVLPPNGHPTPTASSAPTVPPPTLTPTLPPTLTEAPRTDTPPPPACYFQGANDEATLHGLIDLEAKALAQKDLSIIAGIFVSDALIGDAANKQFWRDPQVRYQTYFDSVQSVQVTRTAVEPVERGLLAEIAWFTSGDQTVLTLLDGSEQTYLNLPGSNHWTFAKNTQGCWQITSHVFNAGHFNFPCYCKQPTDDESLRCLIEAESQAVAEENPLLIWAIFAPNAGIKDGAMLLSNDPLAFYQAERFEKYDYITPLHFDITKGLIEGGEAVYTSGSRGSYRDAAGNTLTYDNPAPSDAWRFEQNQAGCWVIAGFAFNQK